MLQLKVTDLVNANTRLKCQLKQAADTQKYDNFLGDEDISFIMNSMSPVSKNKTLKRTASTQGMTPVKKRLRKVANLRLREESLFTDDEQPIHESGEKLIAFMLDGDNYFEFPNKMKRRNTLSQGHSRSPS